jgi:uncharacterized membrane-anchored protein YjiN (DUF445 family)
MTISQKNKITMNAGRLRDWKMVIAIFRRPAINPFRTRLIVTHSHKCLGNASR